IWQTVFVEPRAKNYIQRFEITTDIEKSQARFKVFVSGGSELFLEIISHDGEKFTECQSVHEVVANRKCSLGSAILWDPNSPQLYRLKLTLRDGTHHDVVHSYFGMRSLAAVA